MADIDAILQRNLEEVEKRIAGACARAGRARDKVTLVAVTKYVTADIARRLVTLGVRNLAESRPQELWHKAVAIPEATWHLVGHLQRNKVERTLPVARLIHSVDSARLLMAVNAAAEKQKRTADVLLEVNLSGEAAKHGMSGRELDSLFASSRNAGGCEAEGKAGMPDMTGPSALDDLSHVRVIGFMTMAALDSPGEKARPAFTALRRLRDRLQKRLPPPHDLAHLSMGMTNDFEVAIEEGATLVRIGSALFTGLMEGVLATGG